MNGALAVTPIYTAILSVVFIVLSVRTLLTRRRFQIAVGDAGNTAMLRVMRAHANFAEYVPLTLLMLAMLELNGGHAATLHGLCLCLLIGRLSHAYGVSQLTEPLQFRVFGMALTFIALGGASLRVLLHVSLGI